MTGSALVFSTLFGSTLLGCALLSSPTAAFAGGRSAPTTPTAAASSLQGGQDNGQDTRQDDGRVWVTASDGSKSCEKGSGTPLENGRAALRAKGVEVFDAKKSDDGMMHIQSCGASTGKQNAYWIRRSDMNRAEQLGFRLQSRASP
jgi:hypothetical protein